MGSVLTFQLIYIHANKEIDATKLYWLKNPRIFQDLFLQFYIPSQKSQLPVGLWIISYMFSIALDLNTIALGLGHKTSVEDIFSQRHSYLSELNRNTALKELSKEFWFIFSELEK